MLLGSQLGNSSGINIEKSTKILRFLVNQNKSKRSEGKKMEAKQTIVWRNDLQCRTGKKMAQGAHASLATIANIFREHCDEEGNVSAFKLSRAEYLWWIGNFKKIVLRVDSEEQLLIIYEKAKELGLPTELIIDSGLTEWEGPTKTCISIGPTDAALIDQVTGEKGPLGKLKPM